jgi:lysyl-tRNA synthetase, class II
MVNEKDLTQQASGEHEIRLHKIQELRARHIEPWPYNQPIDATCLQVGTEYTQDEAKTYKVAGRILTVRLHGKTGFATIQDRSGRLQIYLKKDIVGDVAFELFEKMIDIGDIVWCSGASFKTKTGEVTLKVQSFVLLSKCLHPLPEKFHGLADVEMRYRQRYLDLMTDPDSRAKFRIRSKIVSTLRSFLEKHDYIEVETPMLHPIPGGAAARPFVTHHNALDSDFYLRIAPELYLKRLVVGGFERVYEINRNFRNEGISTRHNPEFTMLEFYTAYEDYHFAADFTEQMIRAAVAACYESPVVPFGEHQIDFGKPFKRMSMEQAVLEYGQYSPQDLTDLNIDKILAARDIRLEDKHASWGNKLAILFEEVAEKKLIQPTFIMDYPVDISPLAKRDPRKPNVASRWELFVAGMELGNSYNELNDPLDQAERFQQQAQAHERGDEEAHHYDADFITALEYGLPPTVGVGIGIDRLVMFLTNTSSIKDVILFPTLKKKQL